MPGHSLTGQESSTYSYIFGKKHNIQWTPCSRISMAQLFWGMYWRLWFLPLANPPTPLTPSPYPPPPSLPILPKIAEVKGSMGGEARFWGGGVGKFWDRHEGREYHPSVILILCTYYLIFWNFCWSREEEITSFTTLFMLSKLSYYLSIYLYNLSHLSSIYLSRLSIYLYIFLFIYLLIYLFIPWFFGYTWKNLNLRGFVRKTGCSRSFAGVLYPRCFYLSLILDAELL